MTTTIHYAIVDTSPGNPQRVVLRGDNRGALISAADAYNRNQTPGRFKVVEVGRTTLGLKPGAFAAWDNPCPRRGF